MHIQCLIIISTYMYVRRLFDMNWANDQCNHISSVTRSPMSSICQWTAEQQSLHITGFLRVIYAILNASVILERNEKCLERNEKRLERSKTRLARNETRDGNLLLGGTVNQKWSLEKEVLHVHALLEWRFPAEWWKVTLNRVKALSTKKVQSL